MSRRGAAPPLAPGSEGFGRLYLLDFVCDQRLAVRGKIEMTSHSLSVEKGRVPDRVVGGHPVVGDRREVESLGPHGVGFDRDPLAAFGQEFPLSRSPPRPGRKDKRGPVREGAGLDADVFPGDSFGRGSRVFVRGRFVEEAGVEALPGAGLVVDEQGSSEIPVNDDGLGESSLFYYCFYYFIDCAGLHGCRSAPRSAAGESGAV